MKITILGDLLPQKGNELLFEKANISELFCSEIQNLCNESDFVIANIEGPLTDSEQFIEKHGPCLKSSLESINGIKELGVSIASLGNNHIMDYGEKGLNDTLNIFKNAGIKTVGAGKDKYDASKPLIVESGDIRIGIYTCAEYEFTIATETKGGANPFDEMKIGDAIEHLKNNTDYVICLYHGGKELYPYPAPYVQKRCRTIIDKGADIVLCQHSHCIGCVEKYRNGQVLYGQGNFCLNLNEERYGHERAGLIVAVDIVKKEKEICSLINYIPVLRCGEGVKVASSYDKEAIINAFLQRSEEIKNDGFIEQCYKQFAKNYLDKYYFRVTSGLLGKILMKFRLSCILRLLYRKKDQIELLNVLRCEAHRDLFIQGLVDNIDSIHHL